jgi:hypothetical protein
MFACFADKISGKCHFIGTDLETVPIPRYFDSIIEAKILIPKHGPSFPPHMGLIPPLLLKIPPTLR